VLHLQTRRTVDYGKDWSQCLSDACTESSDWNFVVPRLDSGRADVVSYSSPMRPVWCLGGDSVLGDLLKAPTSASAATTMSSSLFSASVPAFTPGMLLSMFLITSLIILIFGS